MMEDGRYCSWYCCTHIKTVQPIIITITAALIEYIITTTVELKEYPYIRPKIYLCNV
jgi:hypothetical protein